MGSLAIDGRSVKGIHDPMICGLNHPDGRPTCAACRADRETENAAEILKKKQLAWKREQRRTRPEARRLARLFRLHPQLFAHVLMKIQAEPLGELISALQGSKRTTNGTGPQSRRRC
jgi:hypothetical protein